MDVRNKRRGRGFKETVKTPEELREEVFKEINSYPVDINKMVFRKTRQEKEKLKKLKSRFKNKLNI